MPASPQPKERADKNCLSSIVASMIICTVIAFVMYFDTVLGHHLSRCTRLVLIIQTIRGAENPKGLKDPLGMKKTQREIRKTWRKIE